MILAIHALRAAAIALLLAGVHQLGFINPHVQNIAIIAIAYGLVVSLATSMVRSLQTDSLEKFMEELNEKAKKDKKE